MTPPEQRGTTVVLQHGVPTKDAAALTSLLAELLTLEDLKTPLLMQSALLLGDPALAQVAQALCAPAGTCAVQESQSFSGADATLDAGTVVAVANQNDATAARYRFDLPASSATMDTRVRFLLPEAVRALSAPRLQPHLLGQGGQMLCSSTLSIARIARYCALAHDPNPLHVDAAAARAAGFADIVVPGMLLCGLAEQAVHTFSREARAQELRARFLSPALVGAPVQVHVTPAKAGKTRVFVTSAAQDIHAIVDVFV